MAAVGWAYGAGFDRNTEAHAPDAGLDLIGLITARVPVLAAWPAASYTGGGRLH